jgi:hypothetical protein
MHSENFRLSLFGVDRFFWWSQFLEVIGGKFLSEIDFSTIFGMWLLLGYGDGEGCLLNLVWKIGEIFDFFKGFWKFEKLEKHSENL